MNELYCKINLVLLLIFIIQYLCVFMIYNGNNDYNNIPPIFIIIISIGYLCYKSIYNLESKENSKSYDYKIIIINIIYIVILVLILKNQCKSFEIENLPENEIEEGFTNKLKEFKNKKESFKTTTNLNSSRLKKMNNNKLLKNQKEHFGTDDNKDSLESYKNDFKSYRFTRKVKSSMDALNKLPFYIEKFKELW